MIVFTKIILTKLSDVNYEINRSNDYTRTNIVIAYISKLRHYYFPDKFNLSCEEKQTEVKRKLRIYSIQCKDKIAITVKVNY